MSVRIVGCNPKDSGGGVFQSHKYFILRTSNYGMMENKFNSDRIFVLLVIVILYLGIFQICVGAEGSYISHPSRVNSIIDELDTPKISPGESCEITFNLYNPYNESMEDVRLNVSIYKYVYLGVEKNISVIEKTPVFSANRDVEQSVEFPTLESHEKEYIELELSSREDTEEGVYLLRFWLEFGYEGENHVMRSMGYFSEEELVEAGASDNETYQDTGGLDLEQLGVSGILPDSSFSVKSSLPRWPRYVLGVFSVFFGVLAVMFYFQEKYDKFPWLEKTFDHWSSEFKKVGRSFKKRFDKS